MEVLLNAQTPLRHSLESSRSPGPDLCLCGTWYTQTFKDATAVTASIVLNITTLFLEVKLSVIALQLPTSFTIVLSCSSLSHIYMPFVFYLHFYK